MFSYNMFLYSLQISESVHAKWHNSVNLPFVMSQYLSFCFPISWDRLMAALFLTPPKNHRQLAVPGSDLPVDCKQMANWAVFWRSKKKKKKRVFFWCLINPKEQLNWSQWSFVYFIFFNWISYRIIRIEKKNVPFKKKKSHVSRYIFSVKAPVFIHRGPEGN